MEQLAGAQGEVPELLEVLRHRDPLRADTAFPEVIPELPDCHAAIAAWAPEASSAGVGSQHLSQPHLWWCLDAGLS
eukprot:5818609-Prymnesium_polylepis.1